MIRRVTVRWRRRVFRSEPWPLPVCIWSILLVSCVLWVLIIKLIVAVMP